MLACHSHDAEYPDDDWNLYSQIDPNQFTALNVSRPAEAIGIFKPFVRRLEEQPSITSDGDPEIIVMVTFTSPVNLRKIMVIGGGDPMLNHPRQLKCYVNQTNFDFQSTTTVRPSQEFNLVINEEGTIENLAQIHTFTNVNSIVFFFPTNHGNVDQTIIRYIGMQGDHTHYRREAVHTEYELLCSGQDSIENLGEHSAHNHEHSHSHGHDHDHSH